MAELITIRIRKRVCIPVENFCAVVFLLHFDPPYRHAQHAYVTARNRAALDHRLEAIQNGGGDGFLFAVHANGVAIEVVQSWPGGNERAEQLRAWGSAVKVCATCRMRGHVRAVS